MVESSQLEMSSILTFSNPQHENFLYWYAPTTGNQAAGISFRLHLMRWFSSCHPFYDRTTGCGATATDITNFRNSECCDERIPHIDMLPLQSIRHRGSCTRPIQCAESPRAIHVVIQPLCGALQGAECWNFAIENPMARISSPVHPLSAPCLYASSMAVPHPAQFCMIHEVLRDPCGPAWCSGDVTRQFHAYACQNRLLSSTLLCGGTWRLIFFLCGNLTAVFPWCGNGRHVNIICNVQNAISPWNLSD